MAKNGFQWMHWARTQRRPTSQKVILLVIASHCNADGRTYLSYETIAKETDQHRATVIRGLRSLEADGYLRRNGKHHGARGHGHANVWELTGAIQPPLMPRPPSHCATVEASPESHCATTHRRTGSNPPSLSANSNNPRTTHRTEQQLQRAHEETVGDPFMQAVIDTWPTGGATFFQRYGDLEEEAGPEMALAAFYEAQRSGQLRPSVRYLQAIIDRCQRDGTLPGGQKPKGPGKNDRPTEIDGRRVEYYLGDGTPVFAVQAAR